MTIYFSNAEPIDLNAIALMGVSVKTGNSPIGYFGTGLKFSIATLLRTGHEVTLIRNGETIPFSVDSETVRGETFERIRMGDEKLGFTTKLGRNWEPWQAYRELACNCMDEQGSITEDAPEGEHGTVFVVTGEAIEQCHRNRHEIFLASSPAFNADDCEIHTGGGIHAFYRGVRAHKHSRPALFTYNVKEHLELTEDRTIKVPHMLEIYAERAISECNDEEMIEAAIMAPEGTFEQGFDYTGCYHKPSAAFMAVAFRLRGNTHANRHAIKLWEKHADVRWTYEPVELDPFEEEVVEQAMMEVKTHTVPMATTASKVGTRAAAPNAGATSQTV